MCVVVRGCAWLYVVCVVYVVYVARRRLAVALRRPVRGVGRPSDLEEALGHLHRAKEIHAMDSNGEVKSATMLQIGDCHTALMQHTLDGAGGDGGNPAAVSAAAREQLGLACKGLPLP